MSVILNEAKWNEESQHTIDSSFVRMTNKAIISTSFKLIVNEFTIYN